MARRKKSINQIIEQRNRITRAISSQLDAVRSDFSGNMMERNANIRRLEKRYERAMDAGYTYMQNAGKVTGSIYRDQDRQISQRQYMGLANG